ncbi:unnamed protein product [Urochloa decumbens]|uniref:Ubiquitin-like domain-containing protein n=1 Tax=Urochloa decumbens TaxID=240449 RepID=A0ABC9C3X0_9POAL
MSFVQCFGDSKQVLLPDKTAQDKFSHEPERNVCRDLVRTVTAHAPPPPMVNVDFCGLKIKVPAIGATVLDLVWLAMLKQKIRVQVQDFYLMLNFKLIDGSTLVNSIPNLNESVICVCPRLRGGAPVEQPLFYAPLDDIINNNAGQLFSKVQIPQGMVDPSCQHGDVASFWSELPQFIIHQLFLLVCLEGHFEDHCYYGRFDLSRVLMSSSGHVKFSDDVYEHEAPYTPEGGELDYQRLFSIVLTFADVTAEKLPTHVASLLWVLRNAPEPLRQKREFIAFVVNHPALLTFAEKQMLYILINAFLTTLLKTRFSDPNDQAQVAALKAWLQGTRGAGWSGWERSVKKVTAFSVTYMNRAKRPKGTPPGTAKVSNYKPGADHCLRLGRNFLSHKFKVGLKLVEAALSYLLEFILPLVLYNLAMCLSGSNGETFIDIVSNPRADRTTVTGYWPHDDDDDDDEAN